MNTHSTKVEEGKKAAVATYIEQTKLLVTLSSAFLFAPAGLVALLKDANAFALSPYQINQFLWAEGLFIASVFAGYVVLGTIAGTQASGDNDVYRPATRWSSIVQILLYVAGLIVFAFLSMGLVGLVGVKIHGG